MYTQTTPRQDDSAMTPVLYMAFDLGHRKWLIRFSEGASVRDVQIPARDTFRLLGEIAAARSKFGLGRECPVRSCYEAGMDGFWLHRFLAHHGILNLVVDSSSVEVNRRGRSAKTDKLDVAKLMELLMRHYNGMKPWSVVQVPSVADEDDRQIPREIQRLKREVQQHRSRMRAQLWIYGVDISVGPKFEQKLEQLTLWDGTALPPSLLRSVRRELERLRLVEQQLAAVQTQRAERLVQPKTQTEKIAVQLTTLRGLGPTTGWTLATEFFGWRSFRNGKQVGKLAGLSPTPYNSGTRDREQGIDKAGNREIRRLLVQIGWGWLRYQGSSALAQWFEQRFASGGPRMRKIGIVALARKLIVALWHYVEHGIIPEGALLTDPVKC